MENNGYSKYKRMIDTCIAQCNDSNLVGTIEDNTEVKHHVLENGIHVYIKKTRNPGHDIIRISTQELASMEKSEGVQNLQETYLESEVYHYPSISLVIGEYTSGDFPKEKAFIQYNHHEIVDEKMLYSLPKSYRKYYYDSEKVELEEEFEGVDDIGKILEYAISSPDLAPEVKEMYEKALAEYRSIISIIQKTQVKPEGEQKEKTEDKKGKLISEIKGLINEDRKLSGELSEKKKQDEQK